MVVVRIGQSPGVTAKHVYALGALLSVAGTLVPRRFARWRIAAWRSRRSQ
jgi:hypothetical protein